MIPLDKIPRRLLTCNSESASQCLGCKKKHQQTFWLFLGHFFAGNTQLFDDKIHGFAPHVISPIKHLFAASERYIACKRLWEVSMQTLPHEVHPLAVPRNARNGQESKRKLVFRDASEQKLCNNYQDSKVGSATLGDGINMFTFNARSSKFVPELWGQQGNSGHKLSSAEPQRVQTNSGVLEAIEDADANRTWDNLKLLNSSCLENGNWQNAHIHIFTWAQHSVALITNLCGCQRTQPAHEISWDGQSPKTSCPAGSL